MTDLFDTAYPPKSVMIENLLYAGTYLFVGAPKIGKSFFMAQLSVHIATGTPLWQYDVHPGEVLYLALEDDYARIQKRLFKMFGMEGTDSLHFATQSRTLGGGLSDQLEMFINEHPNTKLIIVDTQSTRLPGTKHPARRPDSGIWTTPGYSETFVGEPSHSLLRQERDTLLCLL